MKKIVKKVVLGSAFIATTAPLGIVISCGNSSTKNQMIEEKTLNLIKGDLRKMADIINQPIVGKKLSFNNPTIDDIIDKYTKWITNVSFEVIEIDNTTGTESAVGSKDLAKLGKSYLLRYGLKPNTNTMWWDKTDGIRYIDSIGFSASEAQKNLSISDYSGTEFTLPLPGETISELKVKNYDAIRDKVHIRLGDFEIKKNTSPDSAYSGINEFTTSAVVGNKVRFKMYATPVGNNAWKDGDMFDEREITGLTNNSFEIRWNISEKDLVIDYQNISLGSQSPSIDINLFYGALSKYNPEYKDFPYITLKYYTSKEDEGKEPEELTYGADKYVEPPIWNPESPTKPYMSFKQEIDATTLPADHKFVNIEYRIVNFYKTDSSGSIHQNISSLYNITTTLPYINKTTKDKIMQDNLDLVIYTYPLQYKL